MDADERGSKCEYNMDKKIICTYLLYIQFEWWFFSLYNALSRNFICHFSELDSMNLLIKLCRRKVVVMI